MHGKFCDQQECVVHHIQLPNKGSREVDKAGIHCQCLEARSGALPPMHQCKAFLSNTICPWQDTTQRASSLSFGSIGRCSNDEESSALNPGDRDPRKHRTGPAVDDNRLEREIPLWMRAPSGRGQLYLHFRGSSNLGSDPEERIGYRHQRRCPSFRNAHPSSAVHHPDLPW
jgi:hypothetical protein